MGFVRVGLASFGAFSSGTIVGYHLWTSDSCKTGSIMADTCPDLEIAKPIRFLNQIATKAPPFNFFKRKDFSDEKDVKDLTDTLRQVKTNSLLENKGGERVEEVMEEGTKRMLETFNNLDLTLIGKFMFRREIRSETDRIRSVLKYVDDHPEVIERPPIDDNNGLLVVTGLHRTGSTLMQNLLAQDPNARTPESWEMLSTLDEQKVGRDELIKKKEEELQGTTKLFPGWVDAFRQYHNFQFERPEEDCLIAQHLVPNPNRFFIVFPSDKLLGWWKKELPTLGWYQCRYIHLYFKILDHQREQEQGSIERKHWITKNPDHSNHLTQLLEEYPKANIVVTHRHPDRVVPSWAKLCVTVQFPSFHNDTRCVEGTVAPIVQATSEFGERCLHHMAVASNNLVGHREHLSKTYPELAERIYDVDWKLLMSEPMEEVKRIYNHFGYEFTDEFKSNLENYLNENKRYKRGKVRYSLEEFRLSTSQVHEAMQWYIETYQDKF